MAGCDVKFRSKAQPLSVSLSCFRRVESAWTLDEPSPREVGRTEPCKAACAAAFEPDDARAEVIIDAFLWRSVGRSTLDAGGPRRIGRPRRDCLKRGRCVTIAANTECLGLVAGL